ncbi:cupin domain-containing protein [Cognatishimia sp. SS12]|uniref:cupin domain-containing protein n=1 Tax=Cognatishimia sp. SS12 TaxID=2979465 RepID=UPI00232FC375|nr:cupin domain-containing protein [Cognatishimia sp. SS12]MDC0738957.1 cupin domain-containing protein [Cognatishimia sp. SS12]
MKLFLASVALCLSAMAGLAQDAVTRTELSRHPLSGVAGMEVVKSKMVLLKGAKIPFHTHPGDEHAIVVEGGLMALPNGEIVEFADGTPLFFPERDVHGGLTAQSDTPIVVYTTHIVRAGEPMTVLAE